MTVTYIVVGSMAEPDTPKQPLHKYHADISDLVDVDVIGATGDGSKIKSIALSDKTDVTEIETWLNADLSLQTE